MAQSAFDYSAIHVTSQWLSDCFVESRHLFTPVESHVKTLVDLVSLTTGVGLAEIWSRLSHPIAGSRDVVRLAELDTAAQHLPLTLQGEFVPMLLWDGMNNIAYYFRAPSRDF